MKKEVETDSLDITVETKQQSGRPRHRRERTAGTGQPRQDSRDREKLKKTLKAEFLSNRHQISAEDCNAKAVSNCQKIEFLRKVKKVDQFF